MQLKKEKEKEKDHEQEKRNKSKEIKPKPQGKYSKYTKIVIESKDKDKASNEKKLGKVYTTYKPPVQKRPVTKEKKSAIKPINNDNSKKRSQSNGFKNNVYKKDDYDDELTRQFMSPNPNKYNGFVNDKDNNNNFMLSPTVEIENLIHKKNQYDDKVKEIKNFLKM